MDSHAPDVFSAALEGCRRLQVEFPADEHLQSIAHQLERWKLALNQQGQHSPAHAARWRFDPRYIRPLNEDLARMVHHALVEADRLGLA